MYIVDRGFSRTTLKLDNNGIDGKPGVVTSPNPFIYQFDTIELFAFVNVNFRDPDDMVIALKVFLLFSFFLRGMTSSSRQIWWEMKLHSCVLRVSSMQPP